MLEVTNWESSTASSFLILLLRPIFRLLIILNTKCTTTARANTSAVSFVLDRFDVKDFRNTSLSSWTEVPREHNFQLCDRIAFSYRGFVEMTFRTSVSSILASWFKKSVINLTLGFYQLSWCHQVSWVKLYRSNTCESVQRPWKTFCSFLF